MIKVKSGAIIKDVSKGALKWYKEAGWKVLKEKKEKSEEEANDKTDSKETSTT